MKKETDQIIRDEVTLEMASKLTGISVKVLQQRSRRNRLGLVDSVRPKYCFDFRLKFVTLASVQQFQHNKKLLASKN